MSDSSSYSPVDVSDVQSVDSEAGPVGLADALACIKINVQIILDSLLRLEETTARAQNRPV